MRKPSFAPVCIALCVAFQSEAADTANPFQKELKAALLHASEADIYAPALQYKLSYEKNIYPVTSAVNYFAKGQSEGTLATDKRANSDSLFVEAETGFNLEMTRVATAPPMGTSVGDGVGMPLTGDGGTDAARYGNLMLTAAGRFETDQSFDNYNATFGANLGYVHRNGDTIPLWSLVPKVQLRYHYIEVLQSEDFSRRGIAEESYWRLDALADWTFKVGKWIDPDYSDWYGGLGFHAGFKYYRGIEMPKGAKAADLDRAWQYSGGINYRFKDGSSIGRWISFAYLTVSHGRMPPATVDQTQLFLGIAVNFD